MTFEGNAEDRLAVRERIEAYSDAVYRHDAAAWIANWAQDGVWRLPGLEFSGAPNIRTAWEQAMSAFTVAAFFAVPGSIRIKADRAEARVYTQEVLIEHTGAVRKIFGAYDDVLARRDGAWLFSSRTYRILHEETSGEHT